MKKFLLIFIITYFVATLCRALIGLTYNPFYDAFNFMLLLKDIMVWVLSYTLVYIIVTKLIHQKTNV